LDVQRELEGARMGVDVLKDHTERAHTKQQADADRQLQQQESAAAREEAAAARKESQQAKPAKGSE
jgi:hypothetical protein